MTTTNHYGKWIDSETPTTGVISNNSILWETVDNEICLDCLEMYSNAENPACPECGSENIKEFFDPDSSHCGESQNECEDCGNIFEYDSESEIDFIECSGDHTKLFGDWTEITGPNLEEEKKKCWFIVKGTGYYPNKEGEFAAIESESVTQIVFSKYTKRVLFCSPCYPGQGDLDSSGEHLAYDLPEDMKYKFEEDKE